VENVNRDKTLGGPLSSLYKTLFTVIFLFKDLHFLKFTRLNKADFFFWISDTFGAKILLRLRINLLHLL